MEAILFKILSKIKLKKIAVLSVYFNPDGAVSYQLTVLSRKRGIVSITEQYKDLDPNQEHPCRLISPTIPVYLHLSGKHVMIRTIEKPANTESKLADLMPGFREKDYSFSANPIGSHQLLITLIRKDFLSPLVDHSFFGRFSFSGLFPGPVPYLLLSSQFDTNKSIIHIDEYKLFFSENKLTQIKKAETKNSGENLFMNELRKADEIAAYACGALAYSSPLQHHFKLTEFHTGLQNAFASIWNRLLIQIGLAVLLLSLLTNYFIFDHAYQEHNLLQNQLQSSQQLLKQLKDLEAEVNEKNRFIDENQLGDSYYFSYYADQIGQLTNAGIQLTSLKFNPIKKAIKTGKEINFNKGELEIEGYANTVKYYKQFLTSIDLKPWSTKLITQDYQYNSWLGKSVFKCAIQCNFTYP